MHQHEIYMQRCIYLAGKGAGSVAPNPMVGSVLVYNDLVIGEGYHRQYGEGHAEVNCLQSVCAEHQQLISQSTLYVSLEPCAHYGKTPPCADLIIQHKIPRVVIGCRDPFGQVDGKGIEKLQQAGIDVTVNVLEQFCINMNKRFFTFHLQKRPYIILKWAQTKNGMIGLLNQSQVVISNEVTNRLVHSWRSEEAAIMIGTNTASNDNPRLNTRHWTGNNPTRLVLDLNERLPKSLHVFDGTQRTIVFSYKSHPAKGTVEYYVLQKGIPLPQQIAAACYQLKLLSVIVEGGTQLLQSFIDDGLWDEARVIENREMLMEQGVAAPVLKDYHISHSATIQSDHLCYYKPAGLQRL